MQQEQLTEKIRKKLKLHKRFSDGTGWFIKKSLVMAVKIKGDAEKKPKQSGSNVFVPKFCDAGQFKSSSKKLDVVRDGSRDKYKEFMDTEFIKVSVGIFSGKAEKVAKALAALLNFFEQKKNKKFLIKCCATEKNFNFFKKSPGFESVNLQFRNLDSQGHDVPVSVCIAGVTISAVIESQFLKGSSQVVTGAVIIPEIAQYLAENEGRGQFRDQYAIYEELRRRTPLLFIFRSAGAAGTDKSEAAGNSGASGSDGGGGGGSGGGSGGGGEIVSDSGGGGGGSDDDDGSKASGGFDGGGGSDGAAGDGDGGSPDGGTGDGSDVGTGDGSDGGGGSAGGGGGGGGSVVPGSGAGGSGGGGSDVASESESAGSSGYNGGSEVSGSSGSDGGDGSDVGAGEAAGGGDVAAGTGGGGSEAGGGSDDKSVVSVSENSVNIESDRESFSDDGGGGVAAGAGGGGGFDVGGVAAGAGGGGEIVSDNGGYDVGGVAAGAGGGGAGGGGAGNIVSGSDVASKAEKETAAVDELKKKIKDLNNYLFYYKN